MQLATRMWPILALPTSNSEPGHFSCGLPNIWRSHFIPFTDKNALRATRLLHSAHINLHRAGAGSKCIVGNFPRHPKAKTVNIRRHSKSKYSYSGLSSKRRNDVVECGIVPY